MSDKEMEIGITFSLIIFLNHNYHKKKSSDVQVHDPNTTGLKISIEFEQI